MKKILIILMLLFVLLPLNAKAVTTSGGIQPYSDRIFVYEKAGDSFYLKINVKQEGDFVYELTDGSLPDGLSLSSDGIISGIASDDISSDKSAYVSISDPSDAYFSTTILINFLFIEKDASPVDLNNIYLTSGRVAGPYFDIVYQNGFAFVVDKEASSLNGYISYNDSTKTYNIVSAHDFNGALNHPIIMSFINSEYNKFIKIEPIDSQGLNLPFSGDFLLDLDGTLSFSPDFSNTYFTVYLDDLYSGNNRYLYFKISNVNDDSEYYYVHYSVFDNNHLFTAFESNGGSYRNSIEVTSNNKITKPSDPTKPGYIFAGWYSDEALENEWDFDTVITDNKVLYAKWIAAQTTFNTSDQNIQFTSNAPISSSYVLYVDNATSNYQDIDELIEDATTGEVLKVMDIYFKDNSNNVVAMTNGSYEVKVKIDDDLLGYSSYRVGYVDPTTHKITEWFDATVEDGNIIFNTTHLSEYAIVGVGETNPNTLDNIYEYIIYTTLSAICLTTTLVILKKRNKKHK